MPTISGVPSVCLRCRHEFLNSQEMTDMWVCRKCQKKLDKSKDGETLKTILIQLDDIRSFVLELRRNQSRVSYTGKD
jgi:hypothetical protein